MKPILPILLLSLTLTSHARTWTNERGQVCISNDYATVTVPMTNYQKIAAAITDIPSITNFYSAVTTNFCLTTNRHEWDDGKDHAVQKFKGWGFEMEEQPTNGYVIDEVFSNSVITFAVGDLKHSFTNKSERIGYQKRSWTVIESRSWTNEAFVSHRNFEVMQYGGKPEIGYEFRLEKVGSNQLVFYTNAAITTNENNRIYINTGTSWKYPDTYLRTNRDLSPPPRRRPQ